VLQGRWLPEHTVFLDNRQMRGKPGFDVLTPLRIDGSDAVVVVQRGWVQRNFLDREKLPAVDTPAGSVEVRGRIAPPPPKLYAFGAAESGAIRQNLDLAQFRDRTGLPLLTGLSVQQTGAASEGLLRDWTEPGSGVEKHYGYAFQWFALSALIAILYVWFQFIAPRRKPPNA
jgi:surfeit locus 1 family protein